MNAVLAFLCGMYEFRRCVTTRYRDDAAYERGREWAHRLTCRRYEANRVQS